LIHTIAASLILQHFISEARVGKVDEFRERKVLRLVAITFFVLAAYLIVEGIRVLLQGSVPEQSVWGMVITGVSASVMLLLSYPKKLMGRRLGF
jgi:divalent metal cation (Fe/Co/Zn/Cd) transporter